MSLNWIVTAIVANILILMVICESSNADKSELFETGKMEEPVHQNKRPFFVGSRYGRSEGYALRDSSPIVVARNDRFFMGSRYGKRSQELIPDEFVSVNEQNENINCVYTGFKDFYRCVNERSDRFLNIDSQK